MDNKEVIEGWVVIGVCAPSYYWGKTKDTDPCNGWSISGVTHWKEMSKPPIL